MQRWRRTALARRKPARLRTQLQVNLQFGEYSESDPPQSIRAPWRECWTSLKLSTDKNKGCNTSRSLVTESILYSISCIIIKQIRVQLDKVQERCETPPRNSNHLLLSLQPLHSRTELDSLNKTMWVSDAYRCLYVREKPTF